MTNNTQEFMTDMDKTFSRSGQLIVNMHHAALLALSKARGGQLRKRDLLQAVEASVHLDDWARAVYEGSGSTRWRSIFAFASVKLVKAGYVTKLHGIWTITDEGRAVVTAQPFDARAFQAEVDRRYKVWKDRQIKGEEAAMATSPRMAGPEEDEDDGADLEATPPASSRPRMTRWLLS
jgi:hypothetical protein